MIAHLRGVLLHLSAGHVVLDVGGVGYRVFTPTSRLAGFGEGQECSFHVATLVREDAFQLFGFLDEDLRDAFNLLREVNGVGPRTALAVLDQLELAELQGAVSSGDVAALTAVSGIGKKIAERICLELKTKLQTSFSPQLVPRARTQDPLPLALARLGYKKSEIDRALSDPDVATVDHAPVDQRLSAALHVLGGVR
ncbi:MAG: Holliday junction branch migration protein RuvA [Myxococcota bacterium]|jgi:Holliday junction DNA helicase RuvA|nr:Holliday junction branch migration protein RuvA [Myxococcota bacterium]